MTRVLLLAFGSRGDVQPLLGLAQGLQAAGYDVTVGAGSNFQAWIEGAGFRYEEAGMDVQAVLQSPAGQRWIETSSRNPFAELGHMRRVLYEMGPQGAADILRMSEDADVIVSGALTFSFAAAVCEYNGQRHVRAMFVPNKPSRYPAVNMRPAQSNSASQLNRWGGEMSLRLVWQALNQPSNDLRERLGLRPWNARDYAQAWNATPTLYGLSPVLVPPAADWPGQNAVTGYWYFDEGDDWQPPTELAAFLEAGPPPVYVGFGSMPNSDPMGTLQTISAGLEQSGQRGVVYRGWANLSAEAVPDTIHLLEGAPHKWLFPRMAAVVHHGGAGTTAAALRAGVPMTIVAHMGDQPYWGRRVHELGVAPAFIPRHQLTAERLAAAIHMMTNITTLRERAAALGQQIRAENGVANAVTAFEQMIS